MIQKQSESKQAETSEKLFKATHRGFDPKDFSGKSWGFLGCFSEKGGERRLFQRLKLFIFRARKTRIIKSASFYALACAL
ncbi:MAG: hypothetical protein ACREL1_07805 [bacterium]